MPVRALNNSALRCCVPAAIVPMVSLPGWLRAWSQQILQRARARVRRHRQPQLEEASVVIGSD